MFGRDTSGGIVSTNDCSIPPVAALGAGGRVGQHAAATLASARQVAGDHYKQMGVQPWDVVDTWPLDQRIGYYRGGALKYIMRMGAKDENAQEVAKGQHYIEKLLEVLREKAAA